MAKEQHTILKIHIKTKSLKLNSLEWVTHKNQGVKEQTQLNDP